MSCEEKLCDPEIIKKTEGILLSDMNLSVRLYNCLRRAGYTTLTDIMLADSSKFRKIRNFGKTSEEELKGLLAYVRNASRDDLIALANLNVIYTDSNCIVTPNSEKTVLEMALSERLNVGKILFRDNNGKLVDDISIYEILLSNRTINFLSQNGIVSLRNLANMQYGELEKMQGLGEKCISEIMIAISERVTSVHLSEELNRRIGDLTNLIIDYYSAILINVNLEKVRGLLQKSLMDQYLEGETIDSLEGKEMSYFLSIDPLKLCISEQIYSDASDTIIVGTDIDFLCYSYGFNSYNLKEVFFQ